MIKNNIWEFITICFLIIGFATDFNILSRIFLGVSGAILLADTIYKCVKLRKKY